MRTTNYFEPTTSARVLNRWTPPDRASAPSRSGFRGDSTARYQWPLNGTETRVAFEIDRDGRFV